MEKGVSFYYYVLLQYTPFIPLIVGLSKYSRLEQQRKWFLLYLAVSSLLTVIMTVYVFQGKNNLWLMNIGSPIYVGIILWTFSLWQDKPRIQFLIRMAIILFVIVWCLEITIYDRLLGFTLVAKPILNILLLIAASLTIFQANKNTEVPIIEQPKFWISSGVLLYFGGVMMINLLSKQLLDISQETLRSVLYIHPALNLAAHILYLKGYLQE